MMNRFLLACWLTFFFTAPTGIAVADLVTDWNATMRQVIQLDGTTTPAKSNPGWSTRTMAMVNTAIYDTFQAFDRTHTPFLVDVRANPNTSRDAAVNQAAYDLLVETYPGQQSMLQSVYDARMALIPDGIEKTNGIGLGQIIAEACVDNRLDDHSGDMLPYTPGTAPGQWRPDPYNPDQVAWGPGWGTVETFAVQDTQSFIDALPAIPPLSSEAYADAFDMVKEYGAIDSAVRTAEQTETGLFWAYDRPSMGPPPVMFMQNLHEISMQANNTPEENARLFAMAAVAQADAAVASWDTKFEQSFWRPVTAIHEADLDGNPETDADLTWRPLGAPGNDPLGMDDNFTPPFPAWTSGHATMGGAVFKTLELFYGTNVFDEIDGILGNDPLYMLTSEEADSGLMREYATFTQTGPLGVGLENSPEGENGMSRIYLGIHWIFDQTDGIALGNDIAYYVSAHRFQAVPEPSTLCLALAAAIGGLFALHRRRGRASL
ncbi:MAG: PEP-CTERM sorting domain-containing protein [Pirellulales bacterium]